MPWHVRHVYRNASGTRCIATASIGTSFWSWNVSSIVKRRPYSFDDGGRVRVAQGGRDAPRLFHAWRVHDHDRWDLGACARDTRAADHRRLTSGREPLRGGLPLAVGGLDPESRHRAAIQSRRQNHLPEAEIPTVIRSDFDYLRRRNEGIPQQGGGNGNKELLPLSEGEEIQLEQSWPHVEYSPVPQIPSPQYPQSELQLETFSDP